MKKLISVALILVVCFVICGCSASTVIKTESTSTTKGDFFGGLEYIGKNLQQTEGSLSEYDRFYYYRDVITDVMYICFEEYRKGGLTEMSDPETGLPLTYARYTEIYNNLEVKE